MTTSDTLAAAAREVEHLRGVIVASRADGTLFASWRRHDETWDAKSAALELGAISRANAASLLGAGEATTVVERRDATLVVHGLAGAAVGVLFDAHAPIGMARLYARRILASVQATDFDVEATELRNSAAHPAVPPRADGATRDLTSELQDSGVFAAALHARAQAAEADEAAAEAAFEASIAPDPVGDTDPGEDLRERDLYSDRRDATDLQEDASGDIDVDMEIEVDAEQAATAMGPWSMDPGSTDNEHPVYAAEDEPTSEDAFGDTDGPGAHLRSEPALPDDDPFAIDETVAAPEPSPHRPLALSVATGEVDAVVERAVPPPLPRREDPPTIPIPVDVLHSSRRLARPTETPEDDPQGGAISVNSGEIDTSMYADDIPSYDRETVPLKPLSPTGIERLKQARDEMRRQITSNTPPPGEPIALDDGTTGRLSAALSTLDEVAHDGEIARLRVALRARVARASLDAPETLGRDEARRVLSAIQAVRGDTNG